MRGHIAFPEKATLSVHRQAFCSPPNRSPFFSPHIAAAVAGSEMMPGQIPDPSLAAGSLPSLGPLAGISATTLTDQLKLADFRQLGTMLSPLHFLGRLGKRPLAIKTEVGRKRENKEITQCVCDRCTSCQRVAIGFRMFQSPKLSS